MRKTPCRVIELCLYSVKKNLVVHFAGDSVTNLSLPALNHLDSPLARANLESLRNLENHNETFSQQPLFNLTAIGSNFCHGTEEVCLRN